MYRQSKHIGKLPAEIAKLRFGQNVLHRRLLGHGKDLSSLCKILTGKVLANAIIIDNNIILHFIKYVNMLKICRKRKARGSA